VKEGEDKMETPRTKAGRVTEEIMEVFSILHKPKVADLSTSEYNAVYSHVLRVLNRELGS